MEIVIPAAFESKVEINLLSNIATVGAFGIFVPDTLPIELDPEDCVDELIAASVSYENNGEGENIHVSKLLF